MSAPSVNVVKSNLLSGQMKWQLQSPHSAQIFWFNQIFLFFFFILNSRILADFLRHWGNWIKLIKFETECVHFYTKKVEKPQNKHIFSLHPHFTMCMSLNRLQLNVNIMLPSIFVPTTHFMCESRKSLSQICELKLRFLLRQTRVDSDFA